MSLREYYFNRSHIPGKTGKSDVIEIGFCPYTSSEIEVWPSAVFISTRDISKVVTVVEVGLVGLAIPIDNVGLMY
jgi:hypothetical protein